VGYQLFDFTHASEKRKIPLPYHGRFCRLASPSVADILSTITSEAWKVKK
jgi:hypothetical protein